MDFLWGCRDRRRTRSKARRSRTAPARASGIASRTRPAASRTATPATSPATTTGASQDDVELMHELGSTPTASASRGAAILPQGTGRVNPAGLDFYERLVDALLAARHQADGDALSLGSARRARRSRRLAQPRHRRLVRRLRATSCSARSTIACRCGPRSTSRGSSLTAATCTACSRPVIAACSRRRSSRINLMRAHGTAVQAYRATGRNQIGLVVNLEPKYPASQDEADLAATRRADAYMNRQYLDPVFLRHVSRRAARRSSARRGRRARRATSRDPAADRLPRRQLLHAQRRAGRCQLVAAAYGGVRAATMRSHTETGWEVFPQG